MDFIWLPSYLNWANSRVLEMLQHAPSEESVRILAHLLAAELIWAARVTGEASPCPVRPAWTLKECAEAIPHSVARWQDIASGYEGAKIVTYRNTKGEAFASSAGDILLHVFAHGAYHRGQIGQEVRRAGGELLDTDFILFRRR